MIFCDDPWYSATIDDNPIFTCRLGRLIKRWALGTEWMMRKRRMRMKSVVWGRRLRTIGVLTTQGVRPETSCCANSGTR